MVCSPGPKVFGGFVLEIAKLVHQALLTSLLTQCPSQALLIPFKLHRVIRITKQFDFGLDHLKVNMRIL
jgi:hypothetical protein